MLQKRGRVLRIMASALLLLAGSSHWRNDGAAADQTTESSNRAKALPPVVYHNKEKVELVFDVKDVGPAGLSTVDVYVTLDDGSTWEKDPNPTKPTFSTDRMKATGSITTTLAIEAKIYGFFLVVKSRGGLGEPCPKPGTAPQIRIEKDTTAPHALLFEPQFDGTPGCLILIWKAEDRNLVDKPITLEWASTKAGPWHYIGAPVLPNTGRFHWKLSDDLLTLPSVHLRLSVRDKAGNRAVAETETPVLIDLSVPKIRNVRIKGSSNSR